MSIGLGIEGVISYKFIKQLHSNDTTQSLICYLIVVIFKPHSFLSSKSRSAIKYAYEWPKIGTMTCHDPPQMLAPEVSPYTRTLSNPGFHQPISKLVQLRVKCFPLQLLRRRCWSPWLPWIPGLPRISDKEVSLVKWSSSFQAEYQDIIHSLQTWYIYFV